MDAGTIAVIVLTVVFFGSIIWAEIHSRRKRPASNDKAEETSESEGRTIERTKKKK